MLQLPAIKHAPFSRHQFCAEEEAFGSFYDDVLSNTRRYVSFFAEAADELMPRRTSDIMDEDDTFDVLLRQVCTVMLHSTYCLDIRAQRENIEATADDAHGSNEGLPSILRRRFRVYLKPRTKSEMRILRSIRAADIGHLVTFKVWNLIWTCLLSFGIDDLLKGHMHSRWGCETINRSRLLDV
jgi:DNA replicative helicase MCM subunit Mcm2 (Cdc46/Mcm family)